MNFKDNSTLENFFVEETLGATINRAAIIIRKQLTNMLKKEGYNITPEEFALLSRLWENDGISQSKLVEMTLKDKTRVARLLKGLIEEGYIVKEVDENDRRNFIIYLTNKGKDTRIVIVPIIEQLMKQASEGISEIEVDITKKVLKKVFDNLNNTH